MRDQERDRGGNGLSIIGGPSLERSRSSQLSCLGSGIPSLVGGFGSKVFFVVRVHLSRPVKVQRKG